MENKVEFIGRLTAVRDASFTSKDGEVVKQLEIVLDATRQSNTGKDFHDTVVMTIKSDKINQVISTIHNGQDYRYQEAFYARGNFHARNYTTKNGDVIWVNQIDLWAINTEFTSDKGQSGPINIPPINQPAAAQPAPAPAPQTPGDDLPF